MREQRRVRQRRGAHQALVGVEAPRHGDDEGGDAPQGAAARMAQLRHRDACVRGSL